MLSAWLLYRVVCYALLFVVLTRKIQGSSSNEQRNSSDINLLPTISHQTCHPSEERHELEHAQLLQRLDRNIGKWDKKHPRRQILEALHGFDRYETIVGAEINRFEDLYKHVPKKHKKVRQTSPPKASPQISLILLPALVLNNQLLPKLHRSPVQNLNQRQNLQTNRLLRVATLQNLPSRTRNLHPRHR